MSAYERGFLSIDGIAVDVNFGAMILGCERANAKATALGLAPPLELERRQLIRAAAENRRRLNALAARTAIDATAQIRQQLKATAKRAPTGVSPHLANLIVSAPIQPNTGSVGVALRSRLDRAINPNTPGYGPYWRAQEYGTGSPEVPTQVGRTIVGFFYATGARGAGERPSAQYRGGGGPHPVFISGSARPGARGSMGGKGTISKDIEARHFIRDGANRAAKKWRLEMDRIDRDGARQITRALAAPTRASRVRVRAGARRGRGGGRFGR